MNKKRLLKRLNEEVKEDTNDWLDWYKNILKDSPDKLRTKKAKIEYLGEVETSDEYGNLAWSQGFVSGLLTAISIIKKEVK